MPAERPMGEAVAPTRPSYTHARSVCFLFPFCDQPCQCCAYHDARRITDRAWGDWVWTPTPTPHPPWRSPTMISRLLIPSMISWMLFFPSLDAMFHAEQQAVEQVAVLQHQDMQPFDNPIKVRHGFEERGESPGAIVSVGR